MNLSRRPHWSPFDPAILYTELWAVPGTQKDEQVYHTTAEERGFQHGRRFEDGSYPTEAH